MASTQETQPAPAAPQTAATPLQSGPAAYDPQEPLTRAAFTKQLLVVGLQICVLRLQYVALASVATSDDIWLKSSKPGLPETCKGLFDIGKWNLFLWGYNCLTTVLNLILMTLDISVKKFVWLRLLLLPTQIVISVIGLARVVEAWGSPAAAHCDFLFQVFWWLFLGVFPVIFGGLALCILPLLILRLRTCLRARLAPASATENAADTNV